MGTCFYSRDARNHLCAFGDPVKHVIPVDIPGRIHFWVHEIQQMAEMQEKLVQKGDEVPVVMGLVGSKRRKGKSQLS